MFEGFSGMFGTNDTDPETETEAEETDDQWEFAEETDLEDPPDPGTPDPGTAGGEPAEDAPDVAELEVRLADLEDDLDATESSVRAIQNSQEEMADSVEEVNDTVRRLVGMYDRLAAEDNPFVDDPHAAGDGDGSAASIVGDPADAANGHVATAGTANGRGDGRADDAGAADADADDDVVSFEDLRGTAGGDRDAVEAAGDVRDRSDPVDPAANGESGAAPGGDRPGTDGGGAPGRPPHDRAPLLATVPDGYAGDVLAMEWLASLMADSGPAGALRAIRHYEDAGWISPAVADHLVDVVGGPSLDVFVDPTRPGEPTAQDHTESHAYLQVLDRLNDL
jgi:hypothetical protein